MAIELGRDDSVSVRVDKRLHDLLPASSECSIFKVPIQLRKKNKEAYEPQVLAIGPYHRGKERLKAMEEHKVRYLQMLLQRRNENNVKIYVMVLRGLEERARKCYAESVSINSDNFVEMMLLDGCFIVELIRKYTMTKLRDDNDPIFKRPWMINSLVRDMLLLENQLPFFVLWKLFDMTEMHNGPDQQKEFLEMICELFLEILLGPKFDFELLDYYPVDGIKHLLGFAHDISWLHSPFALKSNTNVSPFAKESNVTSKTNWWHMRCATELREAGVTFKNVNRDSMFDITFKNGIMKIPPIWIENRTESFLRNLIAYEQCSHDRIPIYVFDYIIFMDRLVNSVKDVELLCRRRIIDNTLGDEEVVAKMFNGLCDHVVIHGDFNYSEIVDEVNKHCRKQCNIWKASWRHNYFNSPWAFISFLAASVLLLLTLAQTIYTLLSYYN